MAAFTEKRQPESELYRILLRAVPPNALGNRTIAHLAKLIPCRRWSVIKWIEAEKLTPARAKRIVEIGQIGEPENSPGRVSLEELHPFVYKD
jgi:hypothetical protein